MKMKLDPLFESPAMGISIFLIQLENNAMAIIAPWIHIIYPHFFFHRGCKSGMIEKRVCFMPDSSTYLRYTTSQ